LLYALGCSPALAQPSPPQSGAAQDQSGASRSSPRAAGGGVQPDFDSLIDLIKGTIAPSTWDDVGGPGAIDDFAGGVYVDPQGVMRYIVTPQSNTKLVALRTALPTKKTAFSARRRSDLRRVSLTRLEKHVQRLAAAGRPPTDEMQVLAGLQCIKYVFVYPETGDLVIAGPAGDWQANQQGRTVSVETGKPVMLLDDLVVVLRSFSRHGQSVFGCSINPTQEGLARTKRFLDRSSQRPLKPGQRLKWLDELRSQLGRQDIEIFGIDPQSRVARVLVVADYHMKLIGMGLAESVGGVPSYLDLVKVPPGESPPPLSLLRWWFTLNYRAVQATPERDAFEIRGPGVQLLSENQLLTAQGQRIPTGKSDKLNQEFADNFTTHFDALCDKYPIYAELRNIFDMALAAAIISSDDLDQRVAWHSTFFGDERTYATVRGPAAKQVESVINHRVINRVHILAGVSGGVSVDPWRLVETSAIEVADDGQLQSARGAMPKPSNNGPWWWD
jgi:hypothetical protein